MQKEILIIGAGIAGLSSGCYARMNGYKATIFELHHIPGGLCTAWQRNGYTFDGCLHYLYGSGQGQPFNQLWQELGALRGRDVFDHQELMRVVHPDGRVFTAWADPDRLEQHMLGLSPPDAPLIRRFCGAVRRFTRFDMTAQIAKPRSIMSPRDWLSYSRSLAPFGPFAAEWGMVSAQQFSSRFRDPFLRQAIPLVFGWPEIPMMVGISILAYMHNRNAGFPLGGSLEFAREIERRFLELGGVIHYNAQVEKVLVENDKAVGVRLYNDEEYRGDYVVSCADGQDTIFGMLGGKYADQRLRKLYDGSRPLHSMMQVSLGLKRDLSHEPHWFTYLLEKPVRLAGQERLEIGLKHYCYDPALAPPGHSAVSLILRLDYGYWQRIYGHKLYDKEQEQVEEVLLGQLEQLLPGIRADIEVLDVATPVSYERYTGNWQGSSVGWLLDTRAMRMMVQGMRKTLPGLRNFFMAGQWVEPGGSVPVVAFSGRNAVQLICHQDGRPFQTSTV
jgi:phytoene dehydrogenase-like protein